MAVVYLGAGPDGATVAVKTLPLGVPEEMRRRLKRESELLAAIRDRRVARFIDADTLASQAWVAMEYVTGPSLAEVQVPLEPAPLRQLADGLAEALGSLHSHGLAHRDMKPGNVILTFNGPVLVDLGIAASAELTSITATGIAVGTPAWMAPEQIATGVAGQPADIWGWGSVMFYASTGRQPFAPGPIALLAHRIQHEEADYASVPAWLRDAVGAAMSKAPGQRSTLDTASRAITRSSARGHRRRRRHCSDVRTLASDSFPTVARRRNGSHVTMYVKPITGAYGWGVESY